MPRARRQACAAIVVALVMAVISLSGCGSANSSGTITLTEQDYYTTNPGSAAVNRVLDNYMKLHPNVRIKRTALPGATYVTEVLEEATSGSLPDLLMLDNPYVPQLAQTNLLVPLERFGHFNPQSFIPSTYQAGVDYGKLYALPLYTNSIALFYNKKMLAAAHVSPPTTWAQLLQVARRLTTPSTSAPPSRARPPPTASPGTTSPSSGPTAAVSLPRLHPGGAGAVAAAGPGQGGGRLARGHQLHAADGGGAVRRRLGGDDDQRPLELSQPGAGQGPRLRGGQAARAGAGAAAIVPIGGEFGPSRPAAPPSEPPTACSATCSSRTSPWPPGWGTCPPPRAPWHRRCAGRAR